MLDTPLEK